MKFSNRGIAAFFRHRKRDREMKRKGYKLFRVSDDGSTRSYEGPLPSSMTCLLCRTEFPARLNTKETFICPNCGARYFHDEGFVLYPTYEQAQRWLKAELEYREKEQPC